ncbi:MAG TPA: hypothetical protein VH253_17100 [Phycisphaerae bacterium]|nr:hypothetical protein [Phycisphaerae bacterium]
MRNSCRVAVVAALVLAAPLFAAPLLADTPAPARQPMEYLGGAHKNISCAFTPDGNAIVCGNDDGSIRLWDLATNTTVRVYKGATRATTGVAVSPDGKLLAGAAFDNRLRIWDLASGELLHAFDLGHEVMHVQFSPDGSRLLACGFWDLVKLIDIPSFKPIDNWPGFKAGAYAIGFSRDGKMIATAGEDDAMYLWNAATLKQLFKLQDGDVKAYALDFTPDGKRLVTGHTDGQVRVWDTATGKLLTRYSLARVPIQIIRCNTNATYAATPDKTAQTIVYDLMTGKPAKPFSAFPAPAEVRDVAFSPDGQWIALAAGTVKNFKFASPMAHFQMNGEAPDPVTPAPGGNRTIAAPSGRLTIVKATYGAGDKQLDVTDQLAKRVANGKLAVLAGNGIFGQDPAPNQTKELVVVYQADGKLDIAHFAENSQAVLPPGDTRAVAGAARPASPAPRSAAANPSQAPAHSLKILTALWGVPGKQTDVSSILTAKIKDGRIETWAINDTFATREGDDHQKLLDVTYQADGETYSARFGGETYMLIAAPDPEDLAKLEALRKTQPRGLLIVRAEYGHPSDQDRFRDVTQSVRAAATSTSLTVPVGGAAFARAFTSNFSLRVFYDEGAGKGLQLYAAGDNETLQIGPDVTAFVKGKRDQGSLVPIARAVDQGRAKYGENLFILNALWGAGPNHEDVTDKLQSRVLNNHLAVNVDTNLLGDPAGGSVKTLTVLYYDGANVKTATARENAKLSLEPSLPAAIATLAPLPEYLVEGRPLAHNFVAPGVYKLVKAPPGVTLSPDGHLSWTPTSSELGAQTISFTLTAAGKTYTEVPAPIVLDKNTAALAGGDPAKLSALMHLDLAGDKFQYTPGLHNADALLLEQNHLTVTGPDGTSVLRKLQLQHPYARIAERRDYFVAIRLDPMMMDLLDKNTGAVIKTIKLQYRALRDFVLLPNEPISLVSVPYAESIPSDRIMIVNESTGDVHEPKDFIGTYLWVDPSGKTLLAGLKDIYATGSDFYVNPDWSIIETPTYGDIDMLLAYDISGAKPVLSSHLTTAGANGTGIRVSPDGKRISYLSFTGFPLYSKNLAAWDPLDFEKKPVIYELKDKTNGAPPNALAFHPVLPLAAVPGQDSILLFGRDSGDEDTTHLPPTAAFAGMTFHDVYFSPDGFNVIAYAEKSGKLFLQKIPLTLTDAERAQIKRGLPPVNAAPPPLRVQPNQFGM